ncbi:Kelch motif-containing protein [Nitzschia inconspicua]|uniref:Kelch motif-containing protein n=1 Tax=Nitzschia inconspicua TaxID=303405 RepID=A0A9K3Q301_9STRA|nr:Kelch motif-containing protein [Nitzschia inconspicua]
MNNFNVDTQIDLADAPVNLVDQEGDVDNAAINQATLRQQAHDGAAAAALHRLILMDNNHINPRPEDAVRRLPGGGRGLQLHGDPEHITRGDDVDDLSFNENLASTGGWSEVEVNGGTAPAPRSLHTAAILNGVMYVFGGYDGNTRVNSFHAFSFAEKRWSPVLPSTNNPGPPSPRDRHVAFAFGNSVYIHGGFDGTSRVADFWGFDLSSMTWREVSVLGGRPPSPRHSHSAIVWRDSFFCWGGYDGSYKSDLHQYDFTTSQWNLVTTTGRRPKARYRATAVVFRNAMILYGGHDGTRHLSDTHIFDLENRAWSSLITEGPCPVPRDSHIAVVHSNSMYIFGGSSGTAMSDLHELQLPLSPALPAKWRSVSCGTAEPRPRFCHTAVVHNDTLFIFGGYDGALRLNDFIRFDFSVYDLSFEVPKSTLISDFKAMVDDETLSDVTFIVDGVPVYAHKLMLTRSSYFRALFLGEMKESKMSTVDIQQVSHPIFLQVLEYLYTDQTRIPLETAMELFEAADLFCIPRLKTMCEKRMLQSINVENAASIFYAADAHCASALRAKAKKYILSHFEEISKTACFEDMGRQNIDLVFELLHSR